MIGTLRCLENILGCILDIKILLGKKKKTLKLANQDLQCNKSTQGQERQAPVLDQGLFRCILIITLFECTKQ